MTLKSIHLVNIQSHKDSLLEFPEFGVIRIGGRNSAGKSAVFKPLLYLLSNGIAKPGIRSGLVSRRCPYGEATYTRYDDVSLTIHITCEAATTWVSLAKPGVEPVKRYLADKNYRELAEVFGIHYNANREVSINMSSGDGAILFFTTQHCTNGEVVDMALTDSAADAALESFNMTLKQAQEIRERAISSIPVLEETLSQIQTYDIDALTKKQNELVAYFNVLNTIYIPVIPEIAAVPDVKLFNVYLPKIPVVNYPKVFSVGCKIPDITAVAHELQEVKDGKCPTCGRRLLDAG